MLLTIDVGNTNIEFGLYDLAKKDLLGTFRLMTKGSRSRSKMSSSPAWCPASCTR